MPFTPSMKLKALTKQAIQAATAAVATASVAAGNGSDETSIAATATAPATWAAIRVMTDSPRRSSRRPSRPKKPIAAARAGRACPPPGAMSTAAIRPTAIGAPPPRGVGTECDDRAPGTSSTASLRSSAMVSGSAASPVAPHAATAHSILSPGTSGASVLVPSRLPGWQRGPVLLASPVPCRLAVRRRVARCTVTRHNIRPVAAVVAVPLLGACLVQPAAPHRRARLRQLLRGAPQFAAPGLSGRHDEQHAVHVARQDHGVGHRQDRRAVDEHKVALLRQLGEYGPHPLAGQQLSGVLDDRSRAERPQ